MIAGAVVRISAGLSVMFGGSLLYRWSREDGTHQRAFVPLSQGSSPWSLVLQIGPGRRTQLENIAAGRWNQSGHPLPLVMSFSQVADGGHQLIWVYPCGWGKGRWNGVLMAWSRWAKWGQNLNWAKHKSWYFQGCGFGTLWVFIPVRPINRHTEKTSAVWQGWA